MGTIITLATLMCRCKCTLRCRHHPRMLLRLLQREA
jgi:hypothetical protein